MKFLTLMTPLPMPISLRKTSLHYSTLRVTPFPADCISYELQPLHNKRVPLHDFFFDSFNCIACLYPNQDTRNALDDIDTSRIASFLLEEHSNSKYSKHSMIKNRPSPRFNPRFNPRLLVRACSPQQEKGDFRCMQNQDREDSEISRKAVIKVLYVGGYVLYIVLFTTAP